MAADPTYGVGAVLHRGDIMNQDWEEGFDHEREFADEEDEVEYYAIRPNKTRIKKEIAELFDLGEELSKLTPEQLTAFEFPEIIQSSLLEVADMPHKGARKRLLKYIAGQLHKLDVDPILERMARMNSQSAHGVREHHLAERWRDRLLQEDGGEALTEAIAQWPHGDSQKMNQLIRNARKEAQNNKPPKSARQLYRYFRELIDSDNKGQIGVETKDE